MDATGAGSARGVRDGAVGMGVGRLEQGGGGPFLQPEAECDFPEEREGAWGKAQAECDNRGVGEDGGIVVGIARDLEPRVEQHQQGTGQANPKP